MEIFLQFMVFYLFLGVTCIESIRKVESNQKNVHRTHIFNKLHKADVKLLWNKEMLQQTKKPIHSNAINTKNRESTTNYYFNINENYATQKPLKNLRKRQFFGVGFPYQRKFRKLDFEADHKRISGNVVLQNAEKSGKKRTNSKQIENRHHMDKREVLPDSKENKNENIPSIKPPSDNPSMTTVKEAEHTTPTINKHYSTLLDVKPIAHTTTRTTTLDKTTQKEPHKTPLHKTTTQKAPLLKTTHITPHLHTEMKSKSSRAIRKTLPVTAIPQQTTKKILHGAPTDGIHSNVEELQERKTQCKDGHCFLSNAPGSRFSDGTWAVASMMFILLLLTFSVLYTGLWKKRNSFIYGFKNRDDGAASQQYNKTTVSDVLRRFNVTKKKEMLRLKRMFGGKYNRLPLHEGSDIEEDENSV
ncbi:uncharacterized protein [Antedon mediterranea]|uniref:uncharacterized protein n=1 Tax=Antedon mediterranea TaxID=105859 RepID=UPI003AF9A019